MKISFVIILIFTILSCSSCLLGGSSGKSEEVSEAPVNNENEVVDTTDHTSTVNTDPQFKQNP